MAILQYPGLDQVEGEGTKDALRLIWDQLRELDDRAEVTEGLTTAELEQVQTDLQWKGAHQLNVKGLVGKLQGDQKAAPRIHGHWVQTTVEAGAGLFVWDTMLLDSVPGTFKRTGSNTELRFAVAGTYLIHARLLSGGHASGVVYNEYLNSATIHRILWAHSAAMDVAKIYTGEIFDIIQVAPGDYISFRSSYATRYGNPTGQWSSLYVIRLQ